MMDDWRVRVTITNEQQAALQRWYSVPVDTGLKDLDPVVRRKRVEQIRKHSALGERQIRSTEWRRKNALLLNKAKKGDERAFLELVSRDPQYLCSDLGLFFICNWQSQLNGAYSLLTFNPTLGNLKDHPTRTSLKRISSMLLKPFDRRGKKPTPTGDHVQICYYSALTLFSGLKRLSKQHAPKEREAWVDRIRTGITQIDVSEVRTDSRDGFFIYVVQINAITCKKWPKEFNALSIVSTSPNVLASRLVGKLLSIQERTLRELLKDRTIVEPRKEVPLTWNRSRRVLEITKPDLKLENYPPVQKLLGKK
jgi:hypothetical protein